MDDHAGDRGRLFVSHGRSGLGDTALPVRELIHDLHVAFAILWLNEIVSEKWRQFEAGVLETGLDGSGASSQAIHRFRYSFLN
ncbi:MAG TPA: hypothetical protein VMF31_08100 [Solirubrobacterales bacterium]|nr:hypothetical protein [Solirubrobacterales bacterium]